MSDKEIGQRFRLNWIKVTEEAEWMEEGMDRWKEMVQGEISGRKNEK